MESQPIESRLATKRTPFPWISWGAIFGGLVSGLAVYLLLSLVGLAAGLSAINPQSTEPVGKVPLLTGIWTCISLLISAFAGGYVASRMSGLSRLADGLFHGLVAWGVSTLLLAFLVTTSVGSVLGGAFGILGQAAKAVTGGAAATAGGVAGSPGAQTQLESLLKGSASGGNISKRSISNLQKQLQSGDRDGAINVMVNQMGFTQDRAEQMVDKGMALFGSAQNLPQQARDTATSAVSGLSKVSWWLFIGVLLSMGLSLFGGAVGSKATVRRRSPLIH